MGWCQLCLLAIARESGWYSHKGRGAAGAGAQVLDEDPVFILHGLKPLHVAVLNGHAARVGGVALCVRAVAHVGGD